MKDSHLNRFNFSSSLSLLIFLSVFAFVNPVIAHEPLFGLGPHTIFKDGVGIEMEVEGERASGNGKKESELAIHNEIIYGVTADFAVTLSLPVILDKMEDEGDGEDSASGPGDVALRGKYRFWRSDSPGIQDSAAIVAGVKFPTGDDDTTPRLGTGSTDYTFGLTAARESLVWYYIGDISYRLNTEGAGNLEKGDRVFANASVGLRPFPIEYMKPDIVFFAELNGELLMRNRLNGSEVANSGGNRLFLSPTFFFTYRNWAVRGGLQVPLYQNLYGSQPDDEYRFKLAVEAHL